MPAASERVRAVQGLRTSSLRWNLERLGEPGSLSQAVALLYLPLGMTGPLLLDPGRIGGGVPVWAALGLAAQLVLMACFAVASRIVHPHGSQASRPGATLVAILIAVVVRGVFLAIAPVVLGLTANVDWVYRIVSGAFAQAGGLVVLALLVTTYQHHHRLASALSASEDAARQANAELSRELEQIESAVAHQVQVTIAPLVAEIDTALARIAEGASAADVRASIATLIDDELRPLSERLSRGGDLVRSIAPVAIAAARVPLPAGMPLGRLVSPLTFGLLAGIAAISQSLRGLTMPTAVLFPILAAIAVTALLLGYRVIARERVLPLWLGIVISTAVSGLAYGGSVLLLRTLGLALPLDLVPVGVMVGAFWGILISLYRAVNERRAATEQRLRDSLAQVQLVTSVLRRRSYIASRQLGLVLHGPIQGALHAVALRLAANPSPDASLIAGMRRDIADAVARLEAASSPYTFLVDTLDDIAELWDGTCTVRWTMDHQTVRLLATSPDAAMSAAEIARECVTNAIKHGGATDIWITLARSGDGVLITALDDGVGVADGAVSGVGSRMLDELTVDWSRVRQGRGTKVIARIAVSE